MPLLILILPTALTKLLSLPPAKAAFNPPDAFRLTDPTCWNCSEKLLRHNTIKRKSPLIGTRPKDSPKVISWVHKHKLERRYCTDDHRASLVLACSNCIDPRESTRDLRCKSAIWRLLDNSGLSHQTPSPTKRTDCSGPIRFTLHKSAQPPYHRRSHPPPLAASSLFQLPLFTS